MQMRISRKVNLCDIVQMAILFDELSQGRSRPGGKNWHNISVSPARVKATYAQHAFYRAVVLPIAKRFLNETQGGDETGEDFDEESAHWWLKTTLRPIPI